MLMMSNRSGAGMAGEYTHTPPGRRTGCLPTAGRLIGVCLLLLLVGCATETPSGEWEGPTKPSAMRLETWSYPLPSARIVATMHYRIHTDIADRDSLDSAAQLMEGAYQQYVTLAPDVPLSAAPLNAYLFSRRTHWAAFTRLNTGEDAATYLQVNRGGYTLNDWFAVAWIGDVGTYSVMAHEGWHQFVGRHFAGRLPPFLEEGIACLFETVRWEAGLPQWNLTQNPMRQRGLADAVRGKRLWPLDKLVALHAGDVVSLPTERVEAFYAENWAFARFLWDGDGARYRPALQRLLADTAAGRAWLPPDLARPNPRAWNPKLVQPVLEHYLDESLDVIEPRFQRFVEQLARQQRNSPELSGE